MSGKLTGGLTDGQLAELKKKLVDDQEKYRRMFSSHETIEPVAESLEQAAIVSDVETHKLVGESVKKKMKAILIALEKLNKTQDGDYGICENEDCQGDIGYDRLSRVPYAKLCVKCQEWQEKRKKTMSRGCGTAFWVPPERPTEE